MKKLFYALIITLVMSAMLQGCGSKNGIVDSLRPSETSGNTLESKITEERAYKGVSNYCHDAYDWSVTEGDPSMMYVEMGEESGPLQNENSATGPLVEIL